MQKIFLLRLFSCALYVLLGGSIAFFFLSFLYQETVFSLTYHHWAMQTSLLVIAIFLVQIYLIKWDKQKEKILQEKTEEQQEKSLLSTNNIREDFENFKRESLHAFKGTIKISSLFWIYSIKKEKVLSFEEAKKEVFRSLKKQYTAVPWMGDLLEDIRKDLNKYDKSIKNDCLKPSELDPDK